MSETRWTAGPWSRVPQTQGGDLVAHEFETGKQMNPKGLRIIAFMMSRGGSLKEDEANARLIAAAPALYEALEEMVEMFLATQRVSDWIDDPVLQKAYAAMKQARGES